MIKQTPDQIKVEKEKKYVFEHKKSGRIEGTNELKQAKIIGKSPSWKDISKKEAKK